MNWSVSSSSQCLSSAGSVYWKGQPPWNHQGTPPCAGVSLSLTAHWCWLLRLHTHRPLTDSRWLSTNPGGHGLARNKAWSLTWNLSLFLKLRRLPMKLNSKAIESFFIYLVCKKLFNGFVILFRTYYLIWMSLSPHTFTAMFTLFMWLLNLWIRNYQLTSIATALFQVPCWLLWVWAFLRIWSAA